VVDLAAVITIAKIIEALYFFITYPFVDVSISRCDVENRSNALALFTLGGTPL
jgi:hypothetical protein